MIHVGNCLEVMRAMDANSVDAIVTDPPYGLEFMGKGWDGADGFRRSLNAADAGRDNAFGRMSRKAPEYRAGSAFQEFMHAFAVEALRVLKPGGHMAAFGGTRTFHRATCAIEDAGFEIRDMLSWLYGSGFPKSKNLDGEWDGWGTALKPAWEPIILARKPLAAKNVAANVAEFSTGALNIDGCRIESEGGQEREGEASQDRRYTTNGGTNFAATPGPRGGDPMGRWPANLIHDGSDEVVAMFPQSNGQQGDLTGHSKDRTSKNAYGDMRAARDALARGDTGSAARDALARGDTGSAARFFYGAKASREDRNDGCDGLPLRQSGMVSNTSGQHMTRRDGGAPAPAANNHPTVKPTDLMRWLCRLVTPPGGLVLDPFCGSGSTGRGAIAEGFRFVGIELDPDYAAIAEARIRAIQPGLSFGAVA